ncbi:MAG: TetR/AcrR family transcriptional regulator [Burkholderiales bacterium]|nr:TetR/AcrR family transcriptional regulator [Burkholderiales bacterium]
MRYSTEHKAEARSKIISSAAALAKKNGFGTTGVDDLMGSAGMTGGAFYKHFSTKQDLLSEIVLAEIKRSAAMFVARSDTALSPIEMLEKYLSLAHVKKPEKGCLLPALSAEIGHASEPVKQSFEEQIKQLVSELSSTLGDTEKTWAALSLCVGGVMLARAMKTEAAQQALLDACKKGGQAILK